MVTLLPPVSARWASGVSPRRKPGGGWPAGAGWSPGCSRRSSRCRSNATSASALPRPLPSWSPSRSTNWLGPRSGQRSRASRETASFSTGPLPGSWHGARRRCSGRLESSRATPSSSSTPGSSLHTPRSWWRGVTRPPPAPMAGTGSESFPWRPWPRPRISRWPASIGNGSRRRSRRLVLDGRPSRYAKWPSGPKTRGF